MKAIETIYRGNKFRSRTEARWAVFFTEAGIPFEYEPEGFHLPSGRYLPDFYLPDLKLWFEVKPDATDKSELPRFQELCEQSGMRGVIAYGAPSGSRGNLEFYENGEWHGSMLLLEDRRDQEIYWLAGPTFSVGIGGRGKPTDHDKPPVLSDRLAKAYELASAERFGVEFG